MALQRDDVELVAVNDPFITTDYMVSKVSMFVIFFFTSCGFGILSVCLFKIIANENGKIEFLETLYLVCRNKHARGNWGLTCLKCGM